MRDKIEAALAEFARFMGTPESKEMTCTQCAEWVQWALCAGEVFGFFNDDNPGATIAEYEGGHDFLLLESFLIDPWAAEYLGKRALYDLSNPADQKIVAELYGQFDKWQAVA